MPGPANLHNALVLLVAGALFGFGWAVANFAFGLLSTPGKIIALVVVALVLLALLFGRV